LIIFSIIFSVFGGWNNVSFTGSVVLGAAVMVYLHLYSRRTIREIKLTRAGDFVELKFFNAFWVRGNQTKY
jgi:TMEM70/TMEM186/TMEM223 protein family